MISPNSQLPGFEDDLVRNVPPTRTRHAQRARSRVRRHQADLFGGAGGATLGSRMAYAEMAMMCHITAINHNLDCVTTQRLNHEQHLNLCTGVDRINPRHLYRSEELDALWASPSCTHFSSARGSTPVNPQERASIRYVLHWIRAKKPIVGWIENVGEFVNYGPVIQLRDKRGYALFLRNDGTEKKTKWVRCRAPVPVRPKGMNSRRWWSDMARLGYVPAFMPDPRYKGLYFDRVIRSIRREGYDVQWRVLNCADYGAPTSRRRLFITYVRRDSGMRIVWPNATHAEPDAGGRVPAGMLPHVPMRTALNLKRIGHSIFRRKNALSEKTIHRIITGLFKYGGRAFHSPGKGTDPHRVGDLERPGPVITTTARGEALVTPALAQAPDGLEVTELSPFVTPGFSEREGQTPRTHDIDRPSPAVCAQGHLHVAQPYVIKYRGTSTAASIDRTAPTVTAEGTHLGLVSPYVVQTNHGRTGDTSEASMRVRSVEDPFPTVCGNRGEWAVLQAFLTQVSHGVAQSERNPHNRRVKSLDAPAPALTCSNDWALTQFVLSQQSGGVPRGVDQVAPTVSTKGALQLVTAQIMRYARNPGTGYPSFVIDGHRVYLDVYHRMVDDQELALIQSFPPDYKFAGNKTSKIRQIGNAVPPLMARALVKAFWTQNPNVGPAQITTLEQLMAA